MAFNFLFFLSGAIGKNEQFQCFAFTFLFILVCAVAHANVEMYKENNFM